MNLYCVLNMAPRSRRSSNAGKTAAVAKRPVAKKSRTASIPPSSRDKVTADDDQLTDESTNQSRQNCSISSSVSNKTQSVGGRILHRTIVPRLVPASSPSTITADETPFESDNDIERQHQAAVTQFVTQTVFPHLKFLDNDKYSVTYSTDPQSLCQLVATHCFRNRTMAPSWWEDHGKRIVRATISRLRSDKMQGIKKALNGR